MLSQNGLVGCSDVGQAAPGIGAVRTLPPKGLTGERLARTTTGKRQNNDIINMFFTTLLYLFLGLFVYFIGETASVKARVFRRGLNLLP